MGNAVQTPQRLEVSIRRLEERDLAAADRIFRQAFGTFLGVPDPASFGGDADFVAARWRTGPDKTLGAELDGELVGSNFVTSWGSAGFFGPLTIRPDVWDRGIATRLMEQTLDIFARSNVRHAGLFTFSQSTKHIHLYQKFGFWPRFLTPLMVRPVSAESDVSPALLFSQLPQGQQAAALEACRALTGDIYDGLDVSSEIQAVQREQLGDTLLVWDGSRLASFAVCHCGAGSEAGSGICYVKFGAARPGPAAAEDFVRLLAACEALAAARGTGVVLGGVNTGREQAYRVLLANGFRFGPLVGVTMHRPNEPGYDRPDAFVIDDWR
jgi:GNAT superfamily N-acetyltransferase